MDNNSYILVKTPDQIMYWSSMFSKCLNQFETLYPRTGKSYDRPKFDLFTGVNYGIIFVLDKNGLNNIKITNPNKKLLFHINNEQ